MSLKLRWLLLVVWLSLPFLALGIAGSLWLWEHQWGFYFAAGMAIVSIGSWPLIKQLQKLSIKPLDQLNSEKDPNWAPRAEQAWEEVLAFSKQVNPDDVVFNQPETMWVILRQVLEEIGEVRFISRIEHHLRRPADTEPGEGGHVLVGGQAATQLGHQGAQVWRDIGKAHGAAGTTGSAPDQPQWISQPPCAVSAG